MKIDEMKCNTVDTAMFSSAFPVNPRPFALALNEGCSKNGTDWIRSNEAKRIMWVLMGQCFGQMARVDLCDLWDELLKDYQENNPG